MDAGPIFALSSAVFFAGSGAFARKGMSRAGESFTAVVVTTFLGTVIFLFLLLFTGEWDNLWSLSVRGLALLGTAGIIHFVAGRLLAFTCFRLIGANRGVAISRSNLFYPVIFGIIFLNEPFSTYLIVGVLCIATGIILVSIGKGNKATRMQGRGVAAGLGAGFFWGISGVLIKPAIAGIGSPYPAIFISYLAASVVIFAMLLGKGQRRLLIQLDRQSVISLIISGVFAAAAQLLRYTALSYSPVSIVEPLIGTSVLFIFLYSFLLNRKLEVFTLKVVAGTVVTAIGSFLLFH